jgi:hypothetical protein
MPAKNPIVAVPIAAANREGEGFHRTCAKVTACLQAFPELSPVTTLPSTA